MDSAPPLFTVLADFADPVSALAYGSETEPVSVHELPATVAAVNGA